MKYVHTNIISKDWKALAGFYIQVFNCKLLLPQRDLSGDWLSKATGVEKAHIKGAHLRLPGYGKSGPTLEIFEYDKMEEQNHPLPNRIGFGHLAFEVDDVNKVLEQVKELGGKAYGAVASKTIADLGTLTFVYAQDPEGNIIELQNWGRILSKKGQPEVLEEPVQLPKKDDVVLTVETEGEDVLLETETSLDTNDYDDLESPISKRALLDQLQQDLDASKYDLDATKEEVQFSKENAKYQVQKTKAGLKYDPDTPMKVSKTKQELLDELKDEMQLSDKKKEHLPKPKLPEEHTTPIKTHTPKPKVELPPIPADLRIEYKKDRKTHILEIAELELNLSPDKLAQNLWSFSNLTIANNGEKTFLEELGGAYRADLVPLQKHYKAEVSDEENENAWALTPRLRDSLKHLLGKCEENKAVLENLKLESINLSPKEWIDTYKDLLILTLAVEEEGGTDIRLAYL